MQISEIEIHAGTPSFPYRPVRRLEVKCEAATALSSAPTVEEANGRLRTMAAKVGANAVIEVEYKSGVSMTSWRSLKATGMAVIRESDDRACPRCAETIKRAATLCRFCGAELDQESLSAETPAEGRMPIYEQPIEMAPPLQETNNPQTWLVVGAILFIVLTFIGIAA